MGILGTCQLCFRRTELVDSHVVPQAFWKQTTSGGKGQILGNIPESHPQRTPTGIYSQFVCEPCERLFGPYDQYAKGFLLDRRSEAVPLENGTEVVVFQFLAPDYQRLKLFFVSCLWRAHCSSHPFYARVQLGPFAAEAADMIRQGDAGDPDAFAVLLATFDHELGNAPLDPHPERYEEGPLLYRFYLGSYVAYIKTDRLAFSGEWSRLQLRPQDRFTVVVRSFLDSAELTIMQDIVRVNEARRRTRS
jgi:hypothetical protein